MQRHSILFPEQYLKDLVVGNDTVYHAATTRTFSHSSYSWHVYWMNDTQTLPAIHNWLQFPHWFIEFTTKWRSLNRSASLFLLTTKLYIYIGTVMILNIKMSHLNLDQYICLDSLSLPSCMLCFFFRENYRLLAPDLWFRGLFRRSLKVLNCQLINKGTHSLCLFTSSMFNLKGVF